MGAKSSTGNSVSALKSSAVHRCQQLHPPWSYLLLPPRLKGRVVEMTIDTAAAAETLSLSFIAGDIFKGQELSLLEKLAILLLPKAYQQT